MLDSNHLKFKKINKFYYITFIIIMLLLCFFVLVRTRLINKTICKDCNVIIVSLDTLSANHLPCYGYARDTAPNLCRYADNNVLFTNAFSNASWTLPSHVSIFTGLYPSTHKINDYSASLDNGVKTLPEVLKDNGYRTIFVSPENDNTLPRKTVYNRGVDTFIEESLDDSWEKGIKEFKDSIGKDKKTFLFLHSYDVHELYLIGDTEKIYTDEYFPNIPLKNADTDSSSPKYYDFLHSYLSNKIKDPNLDKYILKSYGTVLDLITQYSDNPILLSELIKPHEYDIWYAWYLYNYRNNLDANNPREVDYVKALYDQRIRQMDESRLASLLLSLDSPEIKKSTLVIITADHGEEFMEHGHVSHETIYDSNLKIPLVMYIPKIKMNKKISTPVQLVDIYPTVLNILGIEERSGVQGESLVPTLFNNKLGNRLMIADGQWLKNSVIRKDGWKLFVKPEAGDYIPYEMYNTVVDPEESNNLLFSNLDKAKNMLNEFKEIRNSN